MNPEGNKNTVDLTKLKNSLGNSFSSALFYLSILFFIIGFNFSDVMVGNWYQQFLPNLNGASIRDIIFTDSLNGHCVTSIGGSNSYILKTTNSGDNWVIKFMHTQPFVRVQFINANTGFTNAFQTIFKTTNAGENWSPINLPGIFGDDMYVLNDSNIWLAMSESFAGGVYRTTNGGASWTNQLNIGSQNPNHIYMYNARIGFIAEDNVYLRKTTDSGLSWQLIPSAGGFLDMYFIDSLTGWKTSFQKTTNGGLNWVNQILPQGGNIITSQIEKFVNISSDTIWGVGGHVFLPGQGNRGMIYRTFNSGNNWLFQIPDTSINIGVYRYIDFVNSITGWSYSSGPGVHTTTGGDPVWLTSVQQINNEVPKEYKLFQNYPNPFNPKTIIRFQINRLSDVNISVYDIQGRLIIELVNQKHNTGTYEVNWNASGYSSGVYFYSLIIDGVTKDTKRMVLVK